MEQGGGRVHVDVGAGEEGGVGGTHAINAGSNLQLQFLNGLDIKFLERLGLRNG